MEHDFTLHQHFLDLLRGDGWLIGFYGVAWKREETTLGRQLGAGGVSTSKVCFSTAAVYSPLFTKGLVCGVTSGKLCSVICGSREEKRG